jgi:hypothetical protein
MVITSAVGAAGVAIGSGSLSSNWIRGQLLEAAGVICFTATAITAVLLIPKQGTGIFGLFWLGLPRLAWVILGIGVLLALGNVVFAFIPSLQATT